MSEIIQISADSAEFGLIKDDKQWPNEQYTFQPKSQLKKH